MNPLLPLERRISAFVRLGDEIAEIIAFLSSDRNDPDSKQSDFLDVLTKTRQANPWFTPDEVLHALKGWRQNLTSEKLNNWLKPYAEKIQKNLPARIAVINAGNIPLVGFHDFLSVLLSGNFYQGKNASDDTVLLPFLASRLINIEPDFAPFITFLPQLKDFDAVIATGSNNTARYFLHYFGKYPHIIRKNRNSVAVLSGKESSEDLIKLGEDIFRYYGLGCRNVSKLMVPVKYNFNQFFEAIYSRAEVMQHNKYMNNYDHHNVVLLMKTIPFLTNDFLILKEDPALTSGIAILHYEHYSNETELQVRLNTDKENIQCIAGRADYFSDVLNANQDWVAFGKTQLPELLDYADGVNTIEFLLGLNRN